MIKAVTKAHAAGTVKVSVTTAAGTATSSHNFTFATAAPTIASFTPSYGSTTGGATVIISGTSLAGATSVKFGSTTAASYSITSPTMIKAVTKAHAAGTVKVSVTTAAGTATSSSHEFTFLTRPDVTGVTPTNGPTKGGSSITITGTNFTGVTAVTFGRIPARTYRVISTSSISATAPSESVGTVNVSVGAVGGTSTSSSANQFTYKPVPTVTSLSPSTGSTSGGTVVTITGTALTGVTEVTFGGTVADTVTIHSSTLITVTAPAHRAGTAEVTVTTPVGSSAAWSSAPSQWYVYVAAPEVHTVSPASGSIAGGSTVTLSGTYLSSATAVIFGTTPSPRFSFVHGEVTAKVPAGSGVVRVSVATPGGTGNTQNYFTYTNTTFGVAGEIDIANGPISAAVNASTGTAYVRNSPTFPIAGSTTVIDLATEQRIATINAATSSRGVSCANPEGVAVNSGYVYLACETSSNVVVFNGTTRVANITMDPIGSTWTCASPMDLAYDSANSEVYVTNPRCTSVLIIDTATNKAIKEISVGGDGEDPQAIAVNTATGAVYVADRNATSVSVIDGDTVTAVVGVGKTPTSIAVNPTSDTAYVGNYGTNDDTWSGSISVIDGSNVNIATLEVRSDIEGVAIDPSTNMVYASALGHVLVINGANQTIVVYIPVDGTSAIVVDPLSDAAYVAGTPEADPDSATKLLKIVSTGALIQAGTSVGSGTAARNDPTCTCTDPVNVASGDFSETVTDASTGGKGTTAKFTRTYDSLRGGNKGVFGYGWSSSIPGRLRPQAPRLPQSSPSLTGQR